MRYLLLIQPVMTALGLGGAKVPEANQAAGEGKVQPDQKGFMPGPSKGFYGGHRKINQRQRRKRAAQVRGG